LWIRYITVQNDLNLQWRDRQLPGSRRPAWI
jgi:hypothetical protein